jgi:predicted transcriptional regulator
MSESTTQPSVDALEAEIRERRDHLSTTIDELITRVSPKELVRREVEDLQIRFAELTRTPDGQVRTELVAAALTAVAVVFIGVGLLRRSRG